MESGFITRFYWDGHDPDGAIVGFQWKLSENGSDGISVHDTLTVDPATGDTLNRWHFTTGTDTTLLVTADLPGYPQDSELDPEDQRFFQSHTMFVRAVDSEGGVDPSPAQVSFTATTLAPWIRVDEPLQLSGYLDVQAVAPTLRLGFTGRDPDLVHGRPTMYRYLFKSAWLGNHYLRTKVEFDLQVDQIASFTDSAWSDWFPYPERPEDRIITFANLPARDTQDRLITYLFAIQARDTAGAVSVDRTYGRNVHNVYISQTKSPQLTVYERYLGSKNGSGTSSHTATDIIPGQEVYFRWYATADHYAGLIEAFRYGWDVAEPDNPDDPNWAIGPGLTSQHLQAQSFSFASGTHTLTVQVWDNSNQVTRMTWLLEVVPVPDPAVQAPVLLVDDVHDQNSRGWKAPDGQTPLDQDRYRDFFWRSTLGGSGGVLGWNEFEDVIDTQDDLLTFRDLVRYRVVIWTSRWAQNNFVWSNFKPFAWRLDPYIWLRNYQETVGNLFFAGSRIMNEFVEESSGSWAGVRWMLPWIFDTDETYEYVSGSWYPFSLGFGWHTMPDGTVVQLGTERFPYKNLGISVLDHVTPKYTVYGYTGAGGVMNAARGSACVGAKAMILDPAFAARYLPDGLAFADTIFTEAIIDWRDLSPGYRDSLRGWSWGNTEFYDGNITERSTQWSPQVCDDQPCIDPMFRIYSRFDWVDDVNLAAGNPGWPAGSIPGQLGTICGSHGVDYTTGRSRTGGQMAGFVTHKLEANKPSQRGDVVWGFDPYRFDHVEIKRAIHWLLGEHFGIDMRP